MPRLSPGQPYYTVAPQDDIAGLTGIIPVTPPAAISANADLVAVHVAARAADIIDLTEDRYATATELVAAYPELAGTRAVDDGDGGSVEVPVVRTHTYNTKYERGA